MAVFPEVAEEAEEDAKKAKEAAAAAKAEAKAQAPRNAVGRRNGFCGGVFTFWSMSYGRVDPRTFDFFPQQKDCNRFLPI